MGRLIWLLFLGGLVFVLVAIAVFRRPLVLALTKLAFRTRMMKFPAALPARWFCARGRTGPRAR